MFHKSLDFSQAGDQVGVLVRGVKKDDVKRGMVLCAPGSVKSHTCFKAQVSLPVSTFPLVSRHTPTDPLSLLFCLTHQHAMLTGVRSKRRGGREAYSFHDQLLSTAVHPYCGCRSLNATTQRYSLCVPSYKVLGLVPRP